MSAECKSMYGFTSCLTSTLYYLVHWPNLMDWSLAIVITRAVASWNLQWDDLYCQVVINGTCSCIHTPFLIVRLCWFYHTGQLFHLL